MNECQINFKSGFQVMFSQTYVEYNWALITPQGHKLAWGSEYAHEQARDMALHVYRETSREGGVVIAGQDLTWLYPEEW